MSDRSSNPSAESPGVSWDEYERLERENEQLRAALRRIKARTDPPDPDYYDAYEALGAEDEVQASETDCVRPETLAKLERFGRDYNLQVSTIEAAKSLLSVLHHIPGVRQTDIFPYTRSENDRVRVTAYFFDGCSNDGKSIDFDVITDEEPAVTSDAPQ